MVKACEGNYFLATFNAVLANVMGVFLSPALIYLILSVQPSVPFYVTLQNLALMVIAPLFAGKILEMFVLKKILEKYPKIPWGESEYNLHLFFWLLTR